MGLTRAQRARNKQLAMARRYRHISRVQPEEDLSDNTDDTDNVCDWDGTVNHIPDDDGLAWTDASDSDWESGSSGDEDSEMEWEGSDGAESHYSDDEMWDMSTSENQHLLAELRAEMEVLSVPVPYEQIMVPKSAKDWKKAEKMRGVYTGNSDRKRRRTAQQARAKATEDEVARGSASAGMMRAFLTPKRPREPPSTSSSRSTSESLSVPSPSSDSVPLSLINDNDEALPAIGYRSDDEGTDADEDEDTDHEHDSAELRFHVSQPPPLKRQKHDISYREKRRIRQEQRQRERELALKAIVKLLDSKKKSEGVFDGGHRSEQHKRARCIESCLYMVVRGGKALMEASAIAAQANQKSVSHGARLIRQWVAVWVEKRELPTSRRGSHAKTFSVLELPEVKEGMAAYLRSHKWVTDPAKFKVFVDGSLLPDVSRTFAEKEVEPAMAKGLQRYLEKDLLPGMNEKGKISLSTAMRCMKQLGFGFKGASKDIFYDGHERPDVKADLHDRFIPEFDKLRPRLVEYVVNDVHEELHKSPREDIQKFNCVEPRLVLVPQDEMTAQCHDGKAKAWGPVDEQPLRHKGVGRGIHQSEVICSTEGHLADAGATLEYGKNYEGYWNGEMFCEQLRTKIIPTFEKTHGPGYKAVFLVDNSQGHSAYADDALLANRMNLNPGGKQARMRDGWFIQNGRRVSQPMVYPSDHAEFPDEPKGMKAVLEERGLWTRRYRMKCPKGCEHDATTCCARRILELQPDFAGQQSLVTEIIEAAGHICLMLPKYHCELNFIEFFWGAVKRYLREHCDYKYDTLKANMPLAMASVPIETIRRWEHRVYRWIDAYRDGLGAKDAMRKVKEFSSRKYKSHRRVPETVARLFD